MVEVIPLENETRIDYLMRCLKAFMEDTPAGSEVIYFDGAECDGHCLMDDIINAIAEAVSTNQPTPNRRNER